MFNAPALSLTAADLRQEYDFAAGNARVLERVQAAAADPVRLATFLGRYATWNTLFGAGVASLAGKIARGRGLFRDEAEAVPGAADRSVLVASYFFDAARDEFDDRVTPHRDTHRCLAQAMLKGLVQVARSQGAVGLSKNEDLERIFAEPPWLTDLCDRVAVGYGSGTPDRAGQIFRSMGYHLGSEVLADEEFTLIDQALRRLQPALVAALETTEVEVAGQWHKAWHWVRVHSGAGGGAEAAHFDWAVRGVHKAFAYTPASRHAALRRQLLLGFRDFCADHGEFFALVGS